MLGARDLDLRRPGDLVDLRFALRGAPHRHRPVVAAEEVQDGNPDPIRLLQSLENSYENPGAYGSGLSPDQVLVGHRRAEAVRDDPDILVPLRLQEVDRELEAFAGIG